MESHDPPDAELFDRVQAGEHLATTNFVGRYGKLVLVVLRNRFPRIDDSDREELVQDVLVDAIKGLGTYERGRSFEAWLLTITRRRAIDLLRKHDKQKVAGEFGRVPLFVSLEIADGPDAPEHLRRQLRASAAEQAPSSDGDDGCAEQSSSGSIRRFGDSLRALANWIETLSPHERIVLGHDLYGFSWEKVSAELSQLGQVVSSKTARVRGKRLRDRARKLLGEQASSPRAPSTS